MVFTAVLEAVFRAWICRLTSEGFSLSTNKARLSNVRCADDVMLFGKTIDEITRMNEMLVEEFAVVGSNMKKPKIKILINACPEFDFFDIAGSMLEIMQNNAYHKHLGRHLHLRGEVTYRENMEVNCRIKCAWFKFG